VDGWLRIEEDATDAFEKCLGLCLQGHARLIELQACGASGGRTHALALCRVHFRKAISTHMAEEPTRTSCARIECSLPSTRLLCRTCRRTLRARSTFGRATISWIRGTLGQRRRRRQRRRHLSLTVETATGPTRRRGRGRSRAREVDREKRGRESWRGQRVRRRGPSLIFACSPGASRRGSSLSSGTRRCRHFPACW